MTLESLPGFPGAGSFKLPADEAHAFTVHEIAKPALAKVDEALSRRQPRASKTTWIPSLHPGECHGEPSFDRPWCNHIAHWKLTADSADQWLLDQQRDLRKLAAEPDRPLSPDDLTWAAIARCRCGAGFTYVKWVHDPHGIWVCSAIFLGRAAAESEHDCAKPFTFWNIKSDDQPSANGATTRPPQ